MLRHVAVQVNGNVLVFSAVLVDKEEVGADLVTAVVAADLDLAVVVLILGVPGHNKLLLGVGRDNYLAKWSVSSPMALGETLTFAVQRLNYIISIIEHVVRRLIIAKQGHLYTNAKSEGATA